MPQPAESQPAPESKPTTPEPAPSASPPKVEEATPAGLYSRDFRTGTPVVDAVIDGYLNHDADRLIHLVRMTPLKCSNAPDYGFPCEKGTPEGTVVPAFYRSTCVTVLMTDTGMIDGDVRTWAARGGYLYAVYRVENLGPRAYKIIFAPTLQETAQSVYLDADGKIVELGMGCNVPKPHSESIYMPIVAPK